MIKRIIVGIIVVMTIFSLVAFYSPIRNIRVTEPTSENSSETSEENLSASVTNPVPITTSTPVSTSTKKSSPSLQDMSGFSDLNQENDLVKKIGTTNASSSSSTLDDIFNDLDKQQ